MVNTRRSAEHAEDTRTSLLDGAEQLFTDPGYAGATLDEVAERARVTKGAVYHHFGSKPVLFRAVVERLFHRLVDELSVAAGEHRLAADFDLWDAVCTTYQKRLDLVCKSPGYQRIVDQDAVAVLGYEELTRIAQSTVNAALVPILTEAVDSGLIKPLSTDILAKLMGSLVSVAGREIAAASDQRRARRDIGEALDAFLQGLRQHKPATKAPRHRSQETGRP
ncbi:MAG TPA: TetR/AcrR family transcriptional regulator [Acidimicrobiales bacterium]|nr:TetR/AcrR family transcriptional regulator [Acidimicrobiales bacterium]